MQFFLYRNDFKPKYYVEHYPAMRAVWIGFLNCEIKITY